MIDRLYDYYFLIYINWIYLFTSSILMI